MLIVISKKRIIDIYRFVFIYILFNLERGIFFKVFIFEIFYIKFL